MRWPISLWRNGAVDVMPPQDAYAVWAPEYPPRPHNALMVIEQETVLSLLPDLTGVTLLDAGCGTGRYLEQTRALGARAVGVDLSSTMLAHARAGSGSLIRADLRALPIHAASVDVVVCGLALGDVPDLERAVAELACVLRPGGCLVYSVVHPSGAAAGWSRSFDAGGRRVAIASCWHTAADHRRACAAAGLVITEWEEPRLAAAGTSPVVLVVRAVR